MGCCESSNPEFIGLAQEFKNLRLDRRQTLKSILGVAGIVAVSTGTPRPAKAQGTKVRLAFCGQLLCVVPYEVTRAQGHFADEGLDVELIYTRGGGAAVQALVGGAVEYAGSSFDVVLQAYKNGAQIRRFASTGRLPLFALAVAPQRTGDIASVADLADTTVGVSALGNADHALLLFLLNEAGVDASSVSFATLGTNLFDALRLGQVDAAMVQEPALTLIVEEGGGELVNFMEIEQAQAQLGGAYEFMGVAVREEERDQRLDEMKRLAAALRKGLEDTRVNLTPDEIIAALPSALIAGGDVDQLKAIIQRYRASLYPETVTIDKEAARRVLEANVAAEILAPGEVDLDILMDTSVLGG
jgi:NitT/TauT family transport system substrate-binding protein